MISFSNKQPQGISNRPQKGKRGFTAVEVVIGATLMTMLIASMLHLLKQGNYLVELSRDHTRITQIIQSEIEDLRTLNWTDLEAMQQFEVFTPEGRFVAAYASDYSCFRYVIDSTENPTEEKWVWVYGTWTDSMNRTHWTWFFTQFSKGGLNDYYYRSV